MTKAVVFRQKAGRWQLTPVDDEHARRSYKMAGSIERTEDSIDFLRELYKAEVSTVLVIYRSWFMRIEYRSCHATFGGNTLTGCGLWAR